MRKSRLEGLYGLACPGSRSDSAGSGLVPPIAAPRSSCCCWRPRASWAVSGRCRAPGRAAWGAAALVALSAFQVWYAQEARAYARLGMLALAAAVLSLALERKITAKLYEFFYKETPEERERGYLGDLLVQPRTTKEIRAYVLADYLLGRHHKLSEDLYEQRRQMYRAGTRISLLTGLITGTALGLAYLFVAQRALHGAINPGGVVLVIGAFTSVSSTLSQLSSTFVAVDQHTTFLDDYFSFLSVGPLVAVPAPPRPAPGSTRGSRPPRLRCGG